MENGIRKDLDTLNTMTRSINHFTKNIFFAEPKQNLVKKDICLYLIQ